MSLLKESQSKENNKMNGLTEATAQGASSYLFRPLIGDEATGRSSHRWTESIGQLPDTKRGPYS